jgi:uncharacterized membrane protein
MTGLVVAAAVFLLIHLVISGTRLRDAITGVIGQGPYMGLFSLASIAVLIWMGFAYGHARGAPGDAVYWTATPLTKWIQLGVTLLAFLLAVPFLWGVALWAAGHLMVNGDVASLILFGSLLFLGVLGTYSIDGKRKRVLGDKWDAFAAKTSAIPFAAIAQGRQSLNLGEIGWWRLALAVILWAALVFAHPYLFGVSPLPGH